MKRNIKQIWNKITTLLVAATVILTLALAGVRLVGLEVFTVLSGSMAPLYPAGSLLYVREAQIDEIAPGDVITFAWSEELIATHRVVDLVPGQTASQISYRTKGDANDTEDSTLVSYDNVIGKPVFMIPKLGFVSHFIQNSPGKYAAMAAGAGLLLLVFLPDLLSDDEENSKDKKDLH